MVRTKESTSPLEAQGKFSDLLNYLQENLIAYEQVFTKFVREKYPLPHKLCRELKLIQKFMNLSNEQVEIVETKVLLQLLRNRKVDLTTT